MLELKYHAPDFSDQMGKVVYHPTICGLETIEGQVEGLEIDYLVGADERIDTFEQVNVKKLFISSNSKCPVLHD